MGMNNMEPEDEYEETITLIKKSKGLRQQQFLATNEGIDESEIGL